MNDDIFKGIVGTLIVLGVLALAMFVGWNIGREEITTTCDRFHEFDLLNHTYSCEKKQ